MTELSDRDLRSVNDFPLSWRWTSETHDLLPPDMLATIEPLTEERRAAPKNVAQYEIAITTEWDDPDAPRRMLARLGIDEDTLVLISWTPTLAVRCPWRTFVRYWNAFCHPSSDDATVWSPSESWTLNYRHFEALQFDRGLADVDRDPEGSGQAR